MFKVTRKIKECKNSLLNWNKSTHVNSAKQITELKKEIQSLDQRNPNEKRKLKVLKSELSNAYQREEQFWAQKARVQWLKEGDKKYWFLPCLCKKQKEKKSVARHSETRSKLV